jgi:agmatinase
MTDPNDLHFGGPDVPDRGFMAARAVVAPMIYEQSPAYGTGSRNGPYHLLTASAQLERMDEETLIDWGEVPLHTLAPLIPDTDPERAVGQMQTAARSVLSAGKFLLSIGGDHAISIGPIAAAAEIHPELGVLQVDAHLDLRQRYTHSRYNHACVMRRVVEDFHLPVVQVGIRSFSPEEFDYVRRRRLQPVYAHRLDPADHAWVEAAVARLPDVVYLTIDLDGLDPSVIPGTGTPEPGGLTYRQLARLIRVVGLRRRVVAADITELAKIEGSQVSEFTAAKIATKIILHCVR